MFVLRPFLSKSRFQILTSVIRTHGGSVTDQLCETASGRTTHLITAAEHNPYSTTLTKLGLPNFPIGIEIVNVDWIGKCVEKKELMSVGPYLVRPTPAPTPTTPAAPAKVKRSPVPMQRLTPVAV